jgi:hypothetical protein
LTTRPPDRHSRAISGNHVLDITALYSMHTCPAFSRKMYAARANRAPPWRSKRPCAKLNAKLNFIQTLHKSILEVALRMRGGTHLNCGVCNSPCGNVQLLAAMVDTTPVCLAWF